LPGNAYSLGLMADLAARLELLRGPEHQQIRDWMRVRNKAVHSQEGVTRSKAAQIVEGVLTIGGRLSAKASR